MLRQLFILLLVALGPAFISGAFQLKTRSLEPLLPGEVRPATARLWGKHVLWVDARTRQQFLAGHLPGAVLLTPEDWEQEAPELFAAWNSNRTVVVYGGKAGDERARKVSQRVSSELKIETVYVLKGGWQAWSR